MSLLAFDFDIPPCNFCTDTARCVYLTPAQCDRGNPCTEYTTGQRRCVHTLLVALALWGAQGRASGGLYAGEEVVGGDGDNGAGGTQRTAQEQLDENPGKYFKGLVNCLNHTSTYRFPEHLPLGMPPAAKGTDTPYTASQEKCSGCGGEFNLVETVPATRITAVSVCSICSKHVDFQVAMAPEFVRRLLLG